MWLVHFYARLVSPLILHSCSQCLQIAAYRASTNVATTHCKMQYSITISTTAACQVPPTCDRTIHTSPGKPPKRSHPAIWSQAGAKMVVETGRYNGMVREERVCRLCQTLGYRDDTTGSIPVEELVPHFMLDCRVLHPVRDNFPLFFKPTSLPGQSKDSHVQFILNHSDHVQVVRCISTLKKRRESC